MDLFITLYAESLLVAIFGGILLAIPGTIVVARNQVFIGATLAQVAALSAVSSSILLPESSWSYYLSKVVIVVAVITSIWFIDNTQTSNSTRESKTALLFLFASSLSLCLLSAVPHGQVMISQLLMSSILGANAREVTLLAILLALFIPLSMRYAKTILLQTIDSNAARVSGHRVTSTNWLISIILGIIFSAVLPATGATFCFGLLVLPALIAARFSTSVKMHLILTPTLAVIGIVTGFIIAHLSDYPPAQVIVSLLTLPLGLDGLISIARK